MRAEVSARQKVCISRSLQWIFFLVAYWMFSYTYWKISLKMPVLENQTKLIEKPPTKLAEVINISQLALSVLIPEVVMFVCYRVRVGNPIGSLQGSEIAIIVLM